MKRKELKQLKATPKIQIITDYLELQRYSISTDELLETYRFLHAEAIGKLNDIQGEKVSTCVNKVNWIVDFQPHIGVKLIDMINDEQIQFMVWFLNNNDLTSEAKIVRGKMFKWQLQNLGYEI